MEYKIKSDTKIEIMVKALMELTGKETETITYALDCNHLTFDFVNFT